MKFLKQFFTWWSGQTLNTRFYTWRKGEFVGRDELGNSYYRAPSAIPDSIPERRWVIYSGYSEASQVPPGWHGWMHHRTDTPPGAGQYTMREWEVPHLENQTGTVNAYRPAGSLLNAQSSRVVSQDYQPWRPE